MDQRWLRIAHVRRRRFRQEGLDRTLIDGHPVGSLRFHGQIHAGHSQLRWRGVPHEDRHRAHGLVAGVIGYRDRDRMLSQRQGHRDRDPLSQLFPVVAPDIQQFRIDGIGGDH